MLKIKITATELKTAFYGLISRLGTAKVKKKKISQRKYQQNPQKLKSKENKEWKKKQYPGTVGKPQKV